MSDIASEFAQRIEKACGLIVEYEKGRSAIDRGGEIQCRMMPLQLLLLACKHFQPARFVLSLRYAT